MKKGKIEIRRFGNYINAVDNEEELRDWIIANVRDKKTEDTDIKMDTPYDECIEIARKEHYSFFIGGLERIKKLLAKVKIEKVAIDLLGAKPRGEVYVADCPMCGTDSVLAVSPKHQIFKCFGCNESGNVISLVMKVKGLAYERTIEYLENNYIKK